MICKRCKQSLCVVKYYYEGIGGDNMKNKICPKCNSDRVVKCSDYNFDRIYDKYKDVE